MRVSILGPLIGFICIECSVILVLVAANGLRIRSNVRPLCYHSPCIAQTLTLSCRRFTIG